MSGPRLIKRLVRRLTASRQKRNPLFDAEWYLATNSDVRSGGHDPFIHYVRHGQFEGRNPNAFFNTDWYLRRYADVMKGHPLDDYLREGAAQGRDPSPLFQGDWYLEQNPDVRSAGLNPLLHYLRHGRREGRLPRPPGSSPHGSVDSGQSTPHAAPAPKVEASSTERPMRWVGPARGTVVIVDEKMPEWDQHAGGLAVWQYIRVLVDVGFGVAFVAHDGVLSEPYTSATADLGVAVLGGPTEARSWFQLNGASVDTVILARPGVAPAYIGLVRDTTSARLLYFTVDLHFVREQRHYDLDGRPEILQRSVELREVEAKIIRAVDAVLTPSVEEARVIGDLVPGKEVHVIPLLAYAAEDLVAPRTPMDERRKIIFVGGFRHQPNVDAVQFLMSEVMPLVWRSAPDTRVMLIGSHPPADVTALASPLVDVIGYVPDLKPYYEQARMSVSPIRFGAGVKGKVIGSLAAGVPVVTTSTGNEAIGLVDGQDALIADDSAGLSAAILKLLDDTDLASALAQRGLALVGERFSTSAVRDALLKAIDQSGLAEGAR